MTQAFEDRDRLNTLDEEAEEELDAAYAAEDTPRSVEIEATRTQIEATRSEMSETIDAIKEKLNPSHLVQQAKDTVREATVGKAQQAMDTAKEAVTGAVDTAREAVGEAVDTARDAGSSMWECIRENPWPAALTMFGAGWFWMNTQKKRAGYRRYRSDYPYDYVTRYEGSQQFAEGSYPPVTGTEYAGAKGGAVLAHEVGERVEEVAGRAREAVGEMTERAQERVHDAAERARYQARLAAGAAEQQWERATDSVQRMFQENPLAVGIAGLALGLVAGMAIPETRQEHRLMGPARDRLVDRAQETARDVSEKVQAVASEAVDTAKEEARRQGLTGEEPSQTSGAATGISDI